MNSQNFSLEYPFPFKPNLHTDLLEKQTRVWIDQCLCLSEKVRFKSKKSNFGKFTANMFSEASFEQLIPMSRWILACVIFDDFYGSCSLEELEKANEKVRKVFDGTLSEVEGLEFFKILADGRKEFIPMVTSDWLKRFEHHNVLWIEGMVTETHYHQKEILIFPSLEEYISIRENISGGRVICDFLEIVSDFIMPEEVFSHPTIKRFRQLIALMTSWYNDIHTFHWELYRKEAMNLVLVIQNERKCSLEKAFEEAVKVHDKDLAEFIQISQNLPDFGKYNEDLQRFVHHAGLLLKGGEIWYSQTKRYTQPEI